MIIFSVIVYSAINYLSHTRSRINLPVPNVLGETVKYLPPQSQDTLNHLDSSPAARFVQDKLDTIKKMSVDFPQKQFTDLKKLVVQNIYQQIMSSLENPKK
jgi:hypothetical protein